jgi:hypothetical protein
MSDFPKGVAAPEGAQKFVDVCKGTWAVIADTGSLNWTFIIIIERSKATRPQLKN